MELEIVSFFCDWIGKLMPRLDPEYLDKAAKFQGYEIVKKED